jgi:hypothetical protein
MMQTILLDTVSWDLVVDNAGNIAVCDQPYALAQDAASACKLFQGELYYDTAQGVSYWQSILGQMPPLALLKAQYIAAAMSVPEIVKAKVFIANITSDRVLTGQVQVTGPGPQTAAADFGSFLMGTISA